VVPNKRLAECAYTEVAVTVWWWYTRLAYYRIVRAIAVSTTTTTVMAMVVVVVVTIAAVPKYTRLQSDPVESRPDDR